MTTERNINAEAEFWRGNLRPDSPLKDALVAVDGTLLVRAYNVWWGVYSSGISRSTTVRRPEGVSSRDATRAADVANHAVLDLLNKDRTKDG